jgi:adenosylhomocysteine nucleosidase
LKSVSVDGTVSRVKGDIMRIGIITAMPEETHSVVRALGGADKQCNNGLKFLQARYGGHEIVLTEAGMGFRNATSAAEKLAQEVSLDLMVSAGFCGGIAQELQVGDVVFATGLALISENGLENVTAVFAASAADFVSRQRAAGERVFAGVFVSTAVIMPKSRIAAILPGDAPYPVVEMESAAIARVAATNSIPFIGLRTVSDPVDEELGFTLDEFCDDQLRIRIPRVLLTIIRKPHIIPQLIRLARNSRIAGASLSHAVGGLLAVVQTAPGR